MMLIEIGENGSLLRDVAKDDFLQEVIEATVAHYQHTGFVPPWIGYVGVDGEVPVGVCGFKGPPADGRVEIAYGTAPGHEGKGVATALASELVKIARKTDNRITVIAQTLPEENASTSILKKLGFRMTGTVEHPDDGLVWKWGLVRSFYSDDLAYIHDVGFSGLSESWAHGLLELLREGGIRSGTVVDLGCGGGGWIEFLNEAGYRPVGVDISPAMIERAKDRVPSAQYHVSSIWEFQIPACRAVTALSEVVCYRGDDSDNPNLQLLFAKIFDALEPGGFLFLDVAEIGLDRARDRTFAEGDDWACLVRFEFDDSRDRLHRHITSFRRLGSMFRRSHEHHVVQLFDGIEVAQLLNAVGFQTESVRAFGAAKLLPMRIGFIAQKPR